MPLNAYQKFVPAILDAIFDADKDKADLGELVIYLRNFADFLEQNGERALPSSFDGYPGFQGAYRQWNITREAALRTKEAA